MLRGSILTLGERAKDTAQQVAARVLAAGGDRIVELARKPWPVKSGRSRAALQSLLQGRRVVISAPGVSYETHIVSGGVRPWVEFILEPTRRYVRSDAPREVGQALVRALRVPRGR